MGNSPSSKRTAPSIFRSSTMEVSSSSLFNFDGEEEEEEDDDEEEQERPKRWLLDSIVEDENGSLQSEIKSSGKVKLWHDLLTSEKIISRILDMYCSDLFDDLLILRLVSRSLMKIVDNLNFISFQVWENSSIDYIVEDEDVKHQLLTCKRMRIIMKILENISKNTREKIPLFLSNNINNRELLFTYNLKERENLTKISNPFLEISKCTNIKCTDDSNFISYFQTPSIEIYLEMNHSSIPMHFNMLLISEETSSFEEYLFRYSISISVDGLWETKIFPMHKRHFFASPKNNSHQIQPITYSKNSKSANSGKFRIIFSFSNNFQLQITTIDIENNRILAMSDGTKVIVQLLSEEYQTKQLASIHNLIREVKISCSSSNLINICKRVSFKTSFDTS